MGNYEIEPLAYIEGNNPDSNVRYSLYDFKTSNKSFLNIYIFWPNRYGVSSINVFVDILLGVLQSGTLIKDEENKSFYIETYVDTDDRFNALFYDNTIKEGINIEKLNGDNYKLIIVEKDSPLIGTGFIGINNNDEAFDGFIIYDKTSLLNYLKDKTSDIKFTNTVIGRINYMPNINYLNSGKVINASGLFKYTQLLREKLKSNQSSDCEELTTEEIDAIFDEAATLKENVYYTVLHTFNINGNDYINPIFIKNNTTNEICTAVLRWLNYNSDTDEFHMMQYDGEDIILNSSDNHLSSDWRQLANEIIKYIKDLGYNTEDASGTNQDVDVDFDEYGLLHSIKTEDFNKNIGKLIVLK